MGQPGERVVLFRRATARPDPSRGWLGVDLGTQSVRAMLVGDDGAVLGAGTRPLASRRWPDGRHEQDPEAWWDAASAACRRALAGAAGVAVRGIACCATSGTVLLVQATSEDPARPLTPGLMYDDGRAVAEARAVARDPAPGWPGLGICPQLSWALPKALWLVRRVRLPTGRVRLAHQVDLITSRLVGRPVATDTSHALKTGADPLSVAWPAQHLERLGLDPRLLPPLVHPGAVLGHVCPAAAERTGVPRGVPVLAGMTDGCAAQIAAGTLRPGQWGFVVGTTVVLKGVTVDLLRDPTGALYSHRAPDRLWWPGGASSAGGGLLGQEFGVTGFARLERHAAAREPAGSVTYPLVGVGERFPFRRPDARRFTVGEPLDEADRFAAVLQGVGFVERLCLDQVRSLGAAVGDRVSLTGGASRSGYWTQLQADILRREVVVPRCPEGAVGMAVLAASGGQDLAAAASRMTAPARVYRPRGEAARFDAPYLRLVTELAERGWVGEPLAAAALAGVVR
ncbi:MAG TPA: FGGY-family carbohydrate kinase [Micromonosporaceae bacterium]